MHYNIPNREKNDKKIGISFSPYRNTYGRYGKEKFLKIKEHGYDAVDYNIYDTDTEVYSLSEDALKQKIKDEKNDALSAGLSFSQVHGPWRWPPQDSTVSDREERLEKMSKAAQITALLGCKNLVVHPIMPYGTEDLKYGNEQKTWDLNIDFFKKLLSFAERYNVTVCIENMPMPNFSLATPEKLLEFVKTINNEHLKICLDTGHVAVFKKLSVGNEVRRLGDYIRVLHIHDNMGDCDSHMFPTKGIVDWKDFLKALDETGFDGAYSLETAPSANLSDECFEAEGKELYNLFKKLITENTNN